MLLGESLQEDWSAYFKTCLDSLVEEGAVVCIANMIPRELRLPGR